MFLGTFRLPGEALQIERLMESLSRKVYLQSPGPLTSADAVFILLFSIIMLNTDLHNKGVKDKMTLTQWLKTNKGINTNETDVPVDYLTDIYNTILNSQIQLMSSNTPAGSNAVVALSQHQWESILHKQHKVASPSFTPLSISHSNSSAVLVTAGVHERAMFDIIQANAIKSMCIMFERSCDDSTVVQIVKGFVDVAKITAYFHMKEDFNHLVIRLCKYWTRYGFM